MLICFSQECSTISQHLESRFRPLTEVDLEQGTMRACKKSCMARQQIPMASMLEGEPNSRTLLHDGL
jgi:hypothetical protein